MTDIYALASLLAETGMEETVTELDAVRAYRDETADHDRTCYTSLNELSGTTHCLVAKADAAIAALLARVEELSNQREQSHAAFHIQKVRADRAEEVIRTLEMMLAAAEERLRVCGTCTHQDIDVDDDGSAYMPHPFVRYECDCHFPGEDYPEENDWPRGKDWGTAKNHDHCHFTPSRWTEATNEAH